MWSFDVNIIILLRIKINWKQKCKNVQNNLLLLRMIYQNNYVLWTVFLEFISADKNRNIITARGRSLDTHTTSPSTVIHYTKYTKNYTLLSYKCILFVKARLFGGCPKRDQMTWSRFSKFDLVPNNFIVFPFQS